MEGEKLGKYEIRRTLGRGAMGVVYEGWDPVIARKVAIKTVALAPAEDAEAREGLARFQREAQAAGRLQHPNIVGVFDYGETATLAYIVMEFVDGESLKAVLDRGERFPLAETVRVLEELLSGLGFSHERGVVHRDIKPANIMLTHAGGVKIADFGIARIESSSMTQAGTVLGTPAYMSPEQFKGEPVDSRTDIYSAGVVLYQLLTGEKPFEGSMSAIMHKVLTTSPPMPSELAVTAPPPFDAVVAQAMAKRPDDRFASASAFAGALRAALTGGKATALPAAEQTVIASRSTPAQAGQPDAARTAAAGTAVSAAAAPAQRRGLPIWIGAAVILIIVIAGGLRLFVFKPASKPPVVVATKTTQALAARAAPETTKAPAPAETSPAPPAPTKPTAAPAAAQAAPPATAVPAAAAAAAPKPASPSPAQQSSPTATAQPRLPSAPGATQASALPPASSVSPPLPPPAPPAPVTEPASTTVTPAGSAPSSSAVASIAASPAAIAKAVANAVAPIPCALVNGSVATAGSVTLGGLAGNAAPAALYRALADVAPTAAINWQVTTFSGGASATYCQVLDLLRPVALPFGAPGGHFTLGLSGGRTVLSDGNPIVFHLSMPDFPAWLTVDYFASDGSVAHLDPGPGNPARIQDASASVLLHGTPAWTVGPPYGRDMIVAIASTKPLFTTQRPESERASAYLPLLAAALDTARSRGERLDATAFLLETHEKPKR